MAQPGKPLPWVIRERILRLHDQGFSRRNIARTVGVAKRTVDKYIPAKNSLCKCSPV